MFNQATAALIILSSSLVSCAYPESRVAEHERNNSRATAQHSVESSYRKKSQGTLSERYIQSPVAQSGNSDSVSGGRTDLQGDPTDPAEVPGTALPGGGANGGAGSDGSTGF